MAAITRTRPSTAPTIASATGGPSDRFVLPPLTLASNASPSRMARISPALLRTDSAGLAGAVVPCCVLMTFSYREKDTGQAGRAMLAAGRAGAHRPRSRVDRELARIV